MSCIPLIHFHDDGTCQVNEEAMSALGELKRNVATISIAGRYRTGKSFLVNRIINDKDPTHGFQVGPTIQPCTKGLWIYKKPIHQAVDSDGEPYDVLVIDTEGTGATNSDNNRDTRLFALAMLISSYFMYNSQGAIDEPALSSLQVVTNVSKMVKVAATDVNPFAGAFDDNFKFAASPKLGDELPRFLWVVRDFALRLTSRSGDTITSDQYLEEALSEDLKQKSDGGVRQSLKGAFPSRGCVTLVRPCNDESNLQDLNHMDKTLMRPEFVDQIQSLRHRVLEETRPKKVYGNKVTGSMLAQLCRYYASAMNDGGIPVIEDAWKTICESQTRRAHDHASETWDAAITGTDRPLPPFTVMRSIRKAHDKAIGVFSTYRFSNDATTSKENTKLMKTLNTKGVAFAHTAIAKWTEMLSGHKDTEFDEEQANGHQLVPSLLSTEEECDTDWSRACLGAHQSDVVAALRSRYHDGASSEQYKQVLGDLLKQQSEAVKLQHELDEVKQVHLEKSKCLDDRVASQQEELIKLRQEVDESRATLAENELKRDTAEGDNKHLQQELDALREKEKLVLETVRSGQTLELELQTANLEITTLNETIAQTRDYTEEIKQDNRQKLEELNAKWSEHVSQLNVNAKSLHEDYNGQLEDCKQKYTEIQKRLKLAEQATQRVVTTQRKQLEQVQKTKVDMQKKHDSVEGDLQKKVALAVDAGKSLETEKRLLKEDIAQKDLQHQDDARKHASEKQLLEISAREMAHRLSSLDDKLSRKRKRCEHLEMQAIEHEGTLSKMKWLEQQRQDLEVRSTTLVQENELLRKDMQRVKEENMHTLTQQSIELKTKESQLDVFRSKCDVLTSRIGQLQNQTGSS